MKVIKFTSKEGVFTVRRKNKVKFYKADTNEEKKHQESFLGQKTWHQIFDTPAPVEVIEIDSN